MGKRHGFINPKEKQLVHLYLSILPCPTKFEKQNVNNQTARLALTSLATRAKKENNTGPVILQKKKAKGQIAAIEMESLIRLTIGGIIKEVFDDTKDNTMKIKLSHLRKIIREAIEEMKLQSAPSRPDVDKPVDEGEVDESEFTYAIAKAAEQGKKHVDIDGKKFPVKMSKDKAEDVLDKDKKKK